MSFPLPALLALLFAAPPHAEWAVPRGSRELTLHASHVILAVPLEPTNPETFRVVDVLRGRELRRGDVVAPDLSAYRVQTFDPAVLPGQPPKPRPIALALLFLGPRPSGDRPRDWPLLPGGLRFCTDDLRVLVPVPRRELLAAPLRYELGVAPETVWPSLLYQVGQDAAVVEDLLTRRRLARPEVRVAALLDWVERHRREFGTPASDADSGEARLGWGEVESQVFDWILERCTLPEAWAALKLQAEVNQGILPPLHAPVFATPAGRQFLVRLALDSGRLLGDRVRALTLLIDPLTLGLERREHRAGVVPLCEVEQTQFLARLLPLLDRSDEANQPPVFRVALIRALARLSQPGGSLPRVEDALTPLVVNYRSETPGPSRDELADAVCTLAPAERWKELTGNPQGVVVCLRDLERDEDHLHFWLTLRSTGGPVLEPPTLVLERLGLFGLPVETKRQPLNPVHLPRPWKDGWTGAELLLVEVSVVGLKAGTWRITAQGTVGKDRVKWTSEPKRFVVQASKR